MLTVEQVEQVELPGWQPVEETLGGAAVVDLPLPDGVGYGGADTWSFQDASGTLYAVLCAERSGQKFGTYCFRRLPSGHREYIQLQEFTEGRVTVSEEPPVGVFLTWLAKGDRVLKRAQLPGLVHPQATGVATPIQVVPTAPQAGGGTDAGVDAEGRKHTSDTKKALEGQIRALDARIKALEARPASAGLSAQQVDDRIWAKLPDALYAVLQSDNQGIVGQILRIVSPLLRK